MLTIKHVEKSGHESLTPAETVCFDPAIGEHGEYPNGQVCAFGVPHPVSDGCDRYSSGIIYVMNDAGRTVSKYDLG